MGKCQNVFFCLCDHAHLCGEIFIHELNLSIVAGEI